MAEIFKNYTHIYKKIRYRLRTVVFVRCILHKYSMYAVGRWTSAQTTLIECQRRSISQAMCWVKVILQPNDQSGDMAIKYSLYDLPRVAAFG